MAASPNAIAQAGNLFVFTMNNPVRWIDPTGLFAQPIGSYLPMPGDVYIRWTPRETSSWTYSWKNPNRVEPGSTPAASPSTTPSVTTGTMRALQPHGGGIIHFGPLTVGMAGNSINEILETDGGGKGGIIRIDHGKKLQQQRRAAERRARIFRTTPPTRPVSSSSTAGQAQAAGPNLANNARMTSNQALSAAERFLGAGYKEISPGVFRSQDGLRQVRMTTSDLAPTANHAGGRPHMNFETGHSIVKPDGRVSFVVNQGQNYHIYLID